VLARRPDLPKRMSGDRQHIGWEEQPLYCQDHGPGRLLVGPERPGEHEEVRHCWNRKTDRPQPDNHPRPKVLPG